MEIFMRDYAKNGAKQRDGAEGDNEDCVRWRMPRVRRRCCDRLG